MHMWGNINISQKIRGYIAMNIISTQQQKCSNFVIRLRPSIQAVGFKMCLRVTLIDKHKRCAYHTTCMCGISIYIRAEVHTYRFTQRLCAKVAFLVLFWHAIFSQLDTSAKTDSHIYRWEKRQYLAVIQANYHIVWSVSVSLLSSLLSSPLVIIVIS